MKSYKWMNLNHSIAHISEIIFCIIIFALGANCKKENTLQESNIMIIQDTVINSTATTSGSIVFANTGLRYFMNNSITARNSNSEIVLLGSGISGFYDHRLDSIVITGNDITWTGTDLNDNNDGILIGYNVNAKIKYNLIQNCPYGISAKSSGLTYTKGGIGYNIFKSSFKAGASAKGVNGMRFYNNTFYNTRNLGENVIGSIYIGHNFDDPSNKPSNNCEVYNNIFYTKHQVPNIYCDQASLPGLKCDYNLYFCEDGEPVISISGDLLTFTQWQAKGFDAHSQVVNPLFADFISLIPTVALPYGKNLGNEWLEGLDKSSQWHTIAPILKSQKTNWQLGAYVQ